ncbi:MAG: FtsX-like permease family protein [Myxococcota bacterium]|nr:FtsX-like permease family protein [Myxococcota bacterium]
MSLVRLAIKNLTRAKRRSLLASAAVVVGVFYLIMGQSFIGGLEEGTIRGVIDGMTGHVTLRPAGYPTEGLDHPVDHLVEVSPELKAWLSENTLAWTGRTVFVATLTSERESMRLRAVGYDPDTDASVFSRKTWSLPNPMPTTADEGIFLTPNTAQLLKVDRGDTLVIEARTHEGALNAMPVKVAAIGKTGNMMFDGRGLFVPQGLIESLLQTKSPTHVSMLLPKRDRSAEAKTELARISKGTLQIIDWVDDSRDMLEMQRVRRTALNILVGMLFLMSSMAIANTVLMAAHERVREVGTLRAMGLSQSGVLRLFLLEGCMLGTVAGAIGACLGGGFAWYLSQNPMDLQAMSGDKIAEGGIQISSYLYGSFSLELVITPLLISIAVALVASVYPARVASLMEPADAVRAD